MGALRTDIIRHFLLKSLAVVCVACVVGLALSVALTRVLSGMLYGVSPADPTTLAIVVTVVLSVATLAALVPAVHAATVDPVRALRAE